MKKSISKYITIILTVMMIIISILSGQVILSAFADTVGSTGGASFTRDNISATGSKLNFGDEDIPSSVLNLIDQDVYSEVEYGYVDLSVYVGGFDVPKYRRYGDYQAVAEKHLIIQFNFGSENIDNIANYIKLYGFSYCVENGLLNEEDYIATYYYRIALDFSEIFSESFYCDFPCTWGSTYISPITKENYFLSFYENNVVDYYLLQDMDAEEMRATLLFMPVGSEESCTEFSKEERPAPKMAFISSGDFKDPTEEGDLPDEPEPDWGWENWNEDNKDNIMINRTLSPIAYDFYLEYCENNGLSALSKKEWAEEQSSKFELLFGKYMEYFGEEYFYNSIFEGIKLIQLSDGTIMVDPRENASLVFTTKLDVDEYGFAVLYFYEAHSKFEKVYFSDWYKSFEDNVKAIYDIYAAKCGDEAISYSDYTQSLNALISKFYTPSGSGNNSGSEEGKDPPVSGDDEESKDPPAGDGTDKDNNGGGTTTDKKFSIAFPPSLENLKNLFDKDFWEALINGEVDGWQNLIYLILLLIALLILLPVLSIFFPIVGTVIKLIFKGLILAIKYLFIGLWWVISLPFKGIAALIGRGKDKESTEDKPKEKNTKKNREKK